MAKSKNNIITHGLSGKVGDMLVFSQRKGQTIVGKVPRERTTPDTPAQTAHKKRFQEAVLYAKAAIQDPAVKEGYQQVADGKEFEASAFNIALADMLGAPQIEEIDLSQYTGSAGQFINISVQDDYKVASVQVKIENADGTLVEEGEAIDKTTHWEYQTTADNPSTTGDKITIRAYDMPDNMSEKQQTL